MHQSIHELLPEMAWQAAMLYKLDEIIGLLKSIEASLPITVIPDDMDWESTDVTDYVDM